jgi:Domain of unknown function (DUF4190)
MSQPPGNEGSGPDEPQDPFAAPPPGGAPPPAGQQPYGQPPYGQPPYGQAPYGQPFAASPGTNGFAIASLVCAFVCSLLGLIFGIVALSQINRTGQKGHGLAVAGIVISAVSLVAAVALVAGSD